MLIKHKNVFEYFSCFWKAFCFKIFHKNPKISTLPFGDSLANHVSHMAPVARLHRSVRDSLASKTFSREKYLEIFSKILGFCHFRNSFSQLLCVWKSKSRGYSEAFMTH